MNINDINTGDGLGVQGTSERAKIIQDFQKLADKKSGFLNHSEIFYRTKYGLYVIGAVEWEKGKIRALVLPTPFEEYLKSDSNLILFKYKKKVVEKKFEKILLKLIGTPYEYTNLVVHQIVRTVTKHIVNWKIFNPKNKDRKGLWIGRKQNADKRVICHEFFQTAWNKYNGLFPECYKGDIANTYYHKDFEHYIIDKKTNELIKI